MSRLDKMDELTRSLNEPPVACCIDLYTHLIVEDVMATAVVPKTVPTGIYL